MNKDLETIATIEDADAQAAAIAKMAATATVDTVDELINVKTTEPEGDAPDNRDLAGTVLIAVIGNASSTEIAQALVDKLLTNSAITPKERDTEGFGCQVMVALSSAINAAEPAIAAIFAEGLSNYVDSDYVGQGAAQEVYDNVGAALEREDLDDDMKSNYLDNIRDTVSGDYDVNAGGEADAEADEQDDPEGSGDEEAEPEDEEDEEAEEEQVEGEEPGDLTEAEQDEPDGSGAA